MNKAKKCRKTFGIHLIAIAFAAIAVTSQAGPVVVTPGSSAGYLYFPPAAVGSGVGSGTNLHPTLGDCETIDTIGATCRLANGTGVKLGAKSGSLKYLYVNLGTIKYDDSLTACKGKGNGFNLVSYNEMSLISSNKAALGMSGVYWTQTLQTVINEYGNSEQKIWYWQNGSLIFSQYANVAYQALCVMAF